MTTCATCGASLEGRRSHARYCSDVCRARGKKGYRAPTVADAVAEVERETEAEPGSLMSLEDVAAHLQRVMRATTTPPTAMAPLAREYLATLEKIKAASPPVRDEVDELLARRIKHA